MPALTDGSINKVDQLLYRMMTQSITVMQDAISEYEDSDETVKATRIIKILQEKIKKYQDYLADQDFMDDSQIEDFMRNPFDGTTYYHEVVDEFFNRGKEIFHTLLLAKQDLLASEKEIALLKSGAKRTIEDLQSENGLLQEEMDDVKVKFETSVGSLTETESEIEAHKKQKRKVDRELKYTKEDLDAMESRLNQQEKDFKERMDAKNHQIQKLIQEKEVAEKHLEQERTKVAQDKIESEARISHIKSRNTEQLKHIETELCEARAELTERQAESSRLLEDRDARIRELTLEKQALEKRLDEERARTEQSRIEAQAEIKHLKERMLEQSAHFTELSAKTPSTKDIPLADDKDETARKLILENQLLQARLSEKSRESSLSDAEAIPHKDGKTLQEKYSGILQLLQSLAPLFSKNYTEFTKLLSGFILDDVKGEKERIQIFLKGIEKLDPNSPIVARIKRRFDLAKINQKLLEKIRTLTHKLRDVRKDNVDLRTTVKELAELKKLREALLKSSGSVKVGHTHLIQYSTAASASALVTDAITGGAVTSDEGVRVSEPPVLYRVLLEPDSAKQGYLSRLLNQTPEAHAWYKGSPGLILGLGAYPGLHKMMQEKESITPRLIFDNNRYYMEWEVPQRMEEAQSTRIKAALLTAGFLNRDFETPERSVSVIPVRHRR